MGNPPRPDTRAHEDLISSQTQYRCLQLLQVTDGSFQINVACPLASWGHFFPPLPQYRGHCLLLSCVLYEILARLYKVFFSSLYPTHTDGNRRITGAQK